MGAERPTPAGREIVAAVAAADGSRLGVQAKTQIDPSEERDYVPGSGRQVFAAAGIRFAVVICHEAFRYPEIARGAVLDGAQVVFVPHYVVTDDGALARRWCDARTPTTRRPSSAGRSRTRSTSRPRTPRRPTRAPRAA